jgi:probable HAF family extracellular repeat protein
LNDRGEAAGELNRVAFLYTPDGSRSLGTLPGDYYSAVYKINNAGQMIGESEDTNDRRRPFFHSGSKMYEFAQVIPRRSPYTVVAAGDINERGQIAARGILRGEARTLLLTPAR